MFYRTIAATLLIYFSSFVWIPSTNSQQQSSSSQGGDLMMLTVTVQNKTGSVVESLHREAFEIIDDKQPRTIEFFDSSDTPLSMAVLVDNSTSMGGLEPGAIGHALSYFFALSNPQNEYSAIVFDSKPRLLTDWKSGRELAGEIAALKPEVPSTAIKDALFAAIEKLRSAHYQKRVIFIITDGSDNSSHHKLPELKETLKRSDILFCSFTVYSSAGSEFDRDGSAMLSEFAKLTGGTALFGYGPQEQKQGLELLATQLRHQYRLGFRPDQGAQPNGWRPLQVKVHLDGNVREEFRNLVVKTRPGYYTR